jgi:hypothetical protein
VNRRSAAQVYELELRRVLAGSRKRRGELIGASVCAAVARRGSRGALSGRGT